ncbi:hypothetical protein BT67DRAFT_261282 [Trichocladium antarcticum]|uniref:Uncharacterized protein n=1 Tax=Trichocladium antarcticum TaxID=1450529 RepID=A0AAN6ZFB4_9PEZI|nr:hypothetical protein BT67DRAFT_261282 [Trichocladium antarcticum]
MVNGQCTRCIANTSRCVQEPTIRAPRVRSFFPPGQSHLQPPNHPGDAWARYLPRQRQNHPSPSSQPWVLVSWLSLSRQICAVTGLSLGTRPSSTPVFTASTTDCPICSVQHEARRKRRKPENPKGTSPDQDRRFCHLWHVLGNESTPPPISSLQSN